MGGDVVSSGELLEVLSGAALQTKDYTDWWNYHHWGSSHWTTHSEAVQWYYTALYETAVLCS